MIQVCEIDKKCCDGKEISPGIFGIGELWIGSEGNIMTLADVGGMLCIIELKLTPLLHN